MDLSTPQADTDGKSAMGMEFEGGLSRSFRLYNLRTGNTAGIEIELNQTIKSSVIRQDILTLPNHLAVHKFHHSIDELLELLRL